MLFVFKLGHLLFPCCLVALCVTSFIKEVNNFDALFHRVKILILFSLAVVVALDNASTARDTVITVREIAPRIRVFARARNLTESKLLVKEGAQIALPETIESSLFLGYGVLEHLGVSQNALTRMLNELRQDNYARVEDPISDN